MLFIDAIKRILATHVHPVSKYLRCLRLSLVVFILIPLASTVAQAQSVAVQTQDVSANQNDADKVERLQSIGQLITVKRIQRDQITALLRDSAPDALQDERERLNTIKQDLESLRKSFDLALLEDIDPQLMSDTDIEQFNWRDELIDVVEPLLSLLKSMTKRPRQIAELQKRIELDTQKLSTAEKALKIVSSTSLNKLNPGASIRLRATQERWSDSYNLVNERLINSRSQLARLQNNQKSFTDSLMTGTRIFFTGRGLTIFIAVISAIIGCWFMRFCWHIFNTQLVKKSVRRKATWYRVLAYSYHLLTLLIVVAIVLTVLYLRQDVLLMGLAFITIATAIISLRAFMPRFVTEVRYLLNLGAVREDECVIHAGLPWQVMSLNILTVLRNPALDGVIRLPLAVMTLKVSRPIVREELWYPTAKHDYIILPDKTFGKIVSQTPDLISLNVRGGMAITMPSADFYASSVLNLSRFDTFGVSVNFGLDYSLQDISLSVIPVSLRAGVIYKLQKAGFLYGEDIVDVAVELAKANDSSLDFLINTTVNNARAADYYALERTVQQACIAVANKNNWTIPFPQITLNQNPDYQDRVVDMRRAA